LSEVKKIIDRIEGERSKIKVDLINLTKHFERLGDIMQKLEKRPSYLRCKANMRTLNAMIRGLSTLSFGMILQDEQDALAKREEIEAQTRAKASKEQREKRVAKREEKAKSTLADSKETNSSPEAQ